VSLPAKSSSPGEIEYIIKKLPLKKSPGHDLIRNIIAKNLPDKTIIFLSHIYSTPYSGYHTFQVLGNNRSSI